MLVDININNELLDSTDKLYENYPNLAKIPNSLDNVELYDAQNSRMLYVMQHEYAILNNNDENIDVIVTDDMTTCVAGILRSHQTLAICLCHFDSIKISVDCKKFENICHEMIINGGDNKNNIDFDLFLIGGYKDERNISDKLVMNILKMFNRITSFRYHIRFVHVGSQNTINNEKYAEPKLTGVAVNVKNCSIQNASFKRPSLIMNHLPVPLYDIRRIYISMHSSSDYVGIYNANDQCLQIPVLHLNCCFFQPPAKQYLEQTLKLSDQQLLKDCSTSPMVEPEHFVDELRQIYQSILNHLNQFGYYSQDQFILKYFPKLIPRKFRIEPKSIQQQQQQQLNDKDNLSLLNAEINDRYQFKWKEI